MEKRIYRRNLPHLFPPDAAIFITWRLANSIPTVVGAKIAHDEGLSDRERFRRMEDYLENNSSGPRWLNDPKVAEMVASVIERGDSEFRRYVLHEYVVMPNHVHLFISPRTEVRAITRTLKGITARFANGLFGLTGTPFWQDESYDHWCRSEDEFHRTQGYIARNPVRAGLAEAPEEWPWSSPARRAR